MRIIQREKKADVSSSPDQKLGQTKLVTAEPPANQITDDGEGRWYAIMLELIASHIPQCM